MYNKEKIYEVVREIKEGTKRIRPYVVIAQPRRSLEEQAAQSLNDDFQMDINVAGFSHGYCNIGGEAVDVARNYLIEQAINSDAKYLLFVGEDTVLPFDGFYKLHEVAEKNPDSMVVGVYYIKLSVPMIMINDNDRIKVANVEPGQVYEAWQTGLDAALIPIALLRKMYNDDPEIPFCCIVNDVEGVRFIGEDNFFVHRWRKAGYRLLVNTDVQCLHMDLANGKYTAHPDIDEKNYFTQIPLNGRLTMADKRFIDERWINRLPHMQKQKEQERLDLLGYKKLNLGSGPHHLDGFLNIDINGDGDVVMDIRSLQFGDSSIEEVNLSHVLEHMANADVNVVLNEINRVLVPGGKFTMEVPDLEYCLKQWLNTPEEDPNKWNFYLMRIFGSQLNDAEYHKTGFNEARIATLLESIGFENIVVERVDSHLQESLLVTSNKKLS